MRHMVVLLASVLLAAIAAVGVSEVDPEKAYAASTVRTCTGGTVNLRAPEKRMLELHNQECAKRDLPRFCVHPALMRAAEAHSKDMIQRDYFSHNTKGRNEGACERVRRYGYRWRACAENIAYGSGTAGSAGRIFGNWMDSPDHRSTFLNGKYRARRHGRRPAPDTDALKPPRGTTHSLNLGAHPA
jgi:uncharacterized protein YkwD